MQHRSLFEVATYAVILVVLLRVLEASEWHLSNEAGGVLALLAGYTLLLVLPVKWFKIGASGIEAEIARLEHAEPKPSPSKESEEQAKAAVSQASQSLPDPRSVFLDLSIEIEKKLRELAIFRGLPGRTGMGALLAELRRREIITNQWLLDSARLFVEKRNQILHEGRTEQIQSAIEIGTLVLAGLQEQTQHPEEMLAGEVRNALQRANIRFEAEPRLMTTNGRVFAPDFMIPTSEDPLYIVEVKGLLSISEAYEVANLGRFLKSNYPKAKTILVALTLAPEMKNFLVSRSWSNALDGTQLKELVSLVGCGIMNLESSGFTGT